ncbi:hypothetical protein ACFLUU_00585 [Chloroflexota bacterium]
MAKKKSSKQNNSIKSVFTNIAARGLNRVAEPLFDKAAKEIEKKLGTDGLSPRDQMALNRDKLKMERQEMENRMYAYKLEEKEIVIQEKQRKLEEIKAEQTGLALPEAEMVIDGALTIPQDRGGIIFPDEP